MTTEDALALLKSINQIIVVANPLLGGLIAVGTTIVNDLRSKGSDIGSFTEEIAKFDAAVSAGLAADDAWRARHGLPPAGTQQGPSSGNTPTT